MTSSVEINGKVASTLDILVEYLLIVYVCSNTALHRQQTKCQVAN